MKIFLGTDHAGFELKEAVKRWLKEQGMDVADEGAFEYNEGDDYPDFIDIVAKQVEADPENSRGLIFGGSGQGEAMCANRFKRVRAAVLYSNNSDVIKLSREHNNANVLSIGARFVKEEEAKQAIKLWLDTNFSGDDRHIRRIAKIDNKLERENFFLTMIIPAVLGSNFSEVEQQVKMLEGQTDWVHLDVTDGKFAGTRSWSAPEDLKFLNGKTKIELHLMVKNPEEMMRDWVDVVDRIIVHPEATDHLEEILDFLDAMPAQSGVALLLNTDPEEIEPYLDRIDIVQFMSIAQIGKQGYAFDESIIDKIKLWRAKHAGVTISVDGGINLDTAPQVLAAGASNLVVGSAVWQSPDPISALQSFQKLIPKS